MPMYDEHVGEAKVTVKMQITVPKRVQELLGGLDKGDYIIFYKDKKGIYIRKGKIKPV